MKLLPIKNGEGIKCIPKEGRLVSNYFLFHQLSVFFVLKRQKKDLEISLSPWKLLASSRGFEPLLTAWKAAVLGRLDDEDVCREKSFMWYCMLCQMFFFFFEKRRYFDRVVTVDGVSTSILILMLKMSSLFIWCYLTFWHNFKNNCLIAWCNRKI